MKLPVLRTEIPGLPLLSRGKVRDIYAADGRLLIVATDRISCFDVILPTGIPDKGRILTEMSVFWFGLTSRLVDNHLISVAAADLPPQARAHPELAGRSMLVRQARVIPLECVVRGYLSGSAWTEYQQSGTAGGYPLPPGLRESDRLPQPLFTPATKAESGHDINLPPEEAARLVGEETYQELRRLSLAVYQLAAEHAHRRGIIIADTKFEFGRTPEGRLMLVDEVLTPDSSRFWDAALYAPGRSQDSFDKQYVRDYLIGIGWNREPPAPELPPEVVKRTRDKYQEALKRLIGAGNG